MECGALFHTVIASPCGDLTVIGDHQRLCGLHMVDQRWPAPLPPGSVADPEPFAEVARQLDEYFSGRRHVFDLPVSPDGTAFQRRVWDALQQIRYGATISYRELARRVGNPGAARAVGLANGRNPISVVIPCHRVIGANGGLTGYGGGLDRKAQLLDLEARVSGARLSF